MVSGGIWALISLLVFAQVKIQIAAGGQHTCAQVGSELKCFGDGSFGQLGRVQVGKEIVGDEKGEMGEMLPTVDLPGECIAVAAGYKHTCAIVRNESVLDLKCFGLNSYGQLGYGDTEARGAHGVAAVPNVDLGLQVIVFRAEFMAGTGWCMYASANFDRLVLGCIDADLYR